MKVGDKVIVDSRFRMAIRIIERETKNFWIVENIKYKKTSLYTTDKWCSGRIMEYNEANYQLFLEFKLNHYNIAKDYQNLTLIQKKEVYNFIKNLK